MTVLQIHVMYNFLFNFITYSCRRAMAHNPPVPLSCHPEEIGFPYKPSSLKVSSWFYLTEIVSSGLLIGDQNLHPDICEAALWKCPMLMSYIIIYINIIKKQETKNKLLWWIFPDACCWDSHTSRHMFCFTLWVSAAQCECASGESCPCTRGSHNLEICNRILQS